MIGRLNHVGVATPSEDPWWWEVLRDGRDAEHAGAFDIDWDTADQRLRIPVVGDDDLLPDGRVDHLRLVEGERGLELHYWDQAFPVAHGTAEGVDDDPQAVHARQHYELVDWHRADDALNYRRFFAVNTLAAVRVEEPEVFDETHVEIRRWFTEGLVDGLIIGLAVGSGGDQQISYQLAGDWDTGLIFSILPCVSEKG